MIVNFHRSINPTFSIRNFKGKNKNESYECKPHVAATMKFEMRIE
jgi:hypothetical protein